MSSSGLESEAREGGLGNYSGMVSRLLALGRERRALKNVPAGEKRLDMPWHAS